ncbi:hypothetical protein [Kocuria sp. NPDC057446]|uniref:hypothetical protein n=1 Tax=Kocuria sp. NPDC057446 TaxID=3346137 RepID=UPI00369DA0DA
MHSHDGRPLFGSGFTDVRTPHAPPRLRHARRLQRASSARGPTTADFQTLIGGSAGKTYAEALESREDVDGAPEGLAQGAHVKVLVRTEAPVHQLPKDLGEEISAIS